MNSLILNREFKLPDDHWYQIAPLGEFVHAGAGVVQIVDAAACALMVQRFEVDTKLPNFAGLLVDFDHFSLDTDKRSEAAGWITALEARLPESSEPRMDTNSHESGSATGGEVGVIRSAGAQANSANGASNGEKNTGGYGLWANIRWSDVGKAAVEGGRYRFLSPVWARKDCEELGENRLRPVRLLNAAVTNDPNLKGMVPLSNRREISTTDGTDTTDRDKASGGGVEPRINTNGHESGNATDGERHVNSLGILPAGISVPGASNGDGDPPSQGLRRDVQDARKVDFESKGEEQIKNGGDEPSASCASRRVNMKKVIEALLNRLGLASDAKEEDVLVAMEKLPSGDDFSALQNSLTEAQGEKDALAKDVESLEQELVNRDLSEFEDVISDSTRSFWTEQLVQNREGARGALGELVAKRSDPPQSRDNGKAGGQAAADSRTRKPLHNRREARPLPRTGAGGDQADAGKETLAVKIRNRAHELCKGEGIAFSVAFQRAERELIED